MADVIPKTTTEAVHIVHASAPKYFKGASDLTFRRRLWLAMLRKYGLVETNADTSFACTWDVEFSQPDVRQYGDSGDQEFNEHDAFRQLTIDVRGYTTTDRLTRKKQLMNKGPTQIIDLYRTKSDRLIKALRDSFCGELYVDGNASGNSNRIHGIESFMSADTGNTTASDIIAPPNDTYAGRDVSLAAEGGNWSTDLASGDRPNANVATDWPYGSGDTEYDYLAPKLINYSSTSWTSGKTTWIHNVEEVLRFAGIVCANLSGDEGTPMCHMLDAKMFEEFQNFYASRNRTVIPHKESEDMGFSKVMNFEGNAVKYEIDVPAGTGYGLTPRMMELFTPQSMLFEPDGPEWSIEKKAYLYEAGFFGNCRFQPKAFAKYKNYA